VCLTDFNGPPRAPQEKYRFTTDAERERRLGELRKAMAADDLAALVVCGRDDIRYRGRTFYVSDVWQLLADTHVVILRDGAPIFIGGQVFGLGQAEETNWAGEFRVNGDPGKEIAAVIKENGLADQRIGVVGISDASFAHKHYEDLAASVPDAALVDATGLFEGVRHSNSPEEMNALEATSSVFRDIYSEVDGVVKAGMTEIELAAAAHRISREHGLRDPMVLLQTTPYGALSFGTTKVIDKSDVVTVWVESAGPSGHWLEYRQCYSFGTPSSEHQEFWELQKASLAAGLDAIRPGAMASDFVNAVQDRMKEGGYDLGFSDTGDCRGMFSLHGIGSDAIQGVWVPGNDRVLKEDEVVNVHPTVQFPTDEQRRKFGWLGVTDNVRVTPDGGRFMTHDENLGRGFIEL
jgi:Xaa-Pro aminopeptidase